MVFETNDPNDAWTGEIRGGNYFAPNGPYNWKTKVASKSTGTRKELNGSVLIVR